MDWNTNLIRPFVPRPDQSSFSFLYNYNYDPFPGGEMKHLGDHMMGVVPPPLDKGGCSFMSSNEKKKRLSSDQLESLENSFQEEIKLDPDRKMKLARELGLQPRQVAVWFQNRRARWKTKQLERLYDALKQEFDAVSREKQKLQDEVEKLKAMLMDQGTRKQISTGYTEISGEETVESTSAGMHSSSKGHGGSPHHHHQQPPPQGVAAAAAECHYLYNVVDEYDTVSPSYWATLPSYP
ncbi:hypothetical protein Dimus_034695 [Dionaea muscipula]